MKRPILSRLIGVVLATAFLLPGCARRRAGAEKPAWSQLALADLAFIHETILENHPGPVDAENPSFREWFENGYQLARGLAARAETPPGYYFALMRYVVGFEDGHLSLSTTGALNIPWSSPGFVVKLEDGRYVVATVQRPAVSPPVGAALLGCDGRNPHALAGERIGEFLFPSEPKARAYGSAPYLLLDAGNPFMRRPKTCVFAVGDARERFDLDWQPTTNIGQLTREALDSTQLDNTMRSLGGGYWLTLSRLLMDGERAQPEALEAIIARVAAEADAMRASPFIVFDLRFNTGGSSTWISRVARILWGEEYVATLDIGSDAVDHRVSCGNYEHFKMIRDRHFTDPGRPGYDYLHALVDGLETGLAHGAVFYRYADGDTEKAESAAPSVPAVAARVFALTDHTCSSACLDAVDLLIAAGAIQIGRETSGDTHYMEVRAEELPSDLGSLVFPTKVYRGRPRGANEPYTPTPEHTWNGRMSDTEALEAWVQTLATGRDR